MALCEAKSREAEPGDIIAITNYHWAVYIGDGTVVRWTIPSEKICCNTESTKPGETMKEKLKGEINVDYKIQNYLDNKFHAQRPDTIIRCVDIKEHKDSYSNCEHFAVELRYGRGAYSKIKPQKGDLIEIPRECWPKRLSHWAIYVGGGEVVHVSPESSLGLFSSSVSATSSKKIGYPTHVKKDKLLCVAEMDPWKVNNYLDQKEKVNDVTYIVNEALRRVGKPFPYNCFYNNCEHFVTELRYGKKVCQQDMPLLSFV